MTSRVLVAHHPVPSQTSLMSCSPTDSGARVGSESGEQIELLGPQRHVAAFDMGRRCWAARSMVSTPSWAAGLGGVLR